MSDVGCQVSTKDPETFLVLFISFMYFPYIKTHPQRIFSSFELITQMNVVESEHFTILEIQLLLVQTDFQLAKIWRA